MLMTHTRKTIKVQMKCFFFIAEFERVAEIRKDRR